MDKIGQLIRKMLSSKNMSSAEFGKLIGVTPKTIDNVIYGKSRKKSLLQRIFGGLGIDIAHYIKDFDNIADLTYPELDLQTYSQATNIIIDYIKKSNIFCTKDQLDILIMMLYEFLLEEENSSQDIAIAFCKGMIEYGLKNLLLSYKVANGTKE